MPSVWTRASRQIPSNHFRSSTRFARGGRPDGTRKRAFGKSFAACDRYLVDGVKVAVGGAEENSVTGNCGRGEDRANGKHLLNAGNDVVVEGVLHGGSVVGRSFFVGKCRAVFLCGLGCKGPSWFL